MVRQRPPLDLKCIEIAARAAKVVEFFYGEPERRLVEMVHAGGALACWQVGSREEAIAAATFVLAQQTTRWATIGLQVMVWTRPRFAR